MQILPAIAVFGCLSTNEIIYVDSFIGPGQVTYTNDTTYIAGGHGTNTARMIKTLLPQHQVYYASKTTKDIHNLWEYPYTAITQLKIDTKYITILPKSNFQPNRVIALIERHTGSKSYIVMPGIIDTFGIEDIDNSEDLFLDIRKTKGIVITSFEIPVETSLRIIQKANNYNIPVLLDMGGIFPNFSLKKLNKSKIFLLKPNRYETQLLTGVDVINEKTAREAGNRLLQDNIENILITAGPQGAYLINKDSFVHFPVPILQNIPTIKNGTGCGDQVIATFASMFLKGDSIEKSAQKAVVSGTLQLYKPGINPIDLAELEDAIHKLYT